jgi:hypothetical protein
VPGQTGKAGAVAANCVSGPRTQPWKVRRKPGSQPKVRPGTVAAADLSRFPEGATPALCPGGRRYESCTAHHLFQGSLDGHASAVPCRTTRDRQLADSNPGLPTSLLELLRWFDIPQHAQEDVAKAVIALCREIGGDDNYIRAEAARRELTLRRERVLEMYRDGLCERKSRDCKYWNSQIYTLGSPGRVRNLHRKTPLERRERW